MSYKSLVINQPTIIFHFMPPIAKKPIVVFILLCFLFASGPTKANQATVPLNITVSGKLIISNSESDNKSGIDPTLNVLLRLIPDLNNSVVSGKAAIRIRTNLNNWKLTAQRRDLTEHSTNISPDDISVSFTTQNGSKANPNSGKLLSPFNTTTSLNQISTSNPITILEGSTKTSLDRDPSNQNNWFQLTSNYSISPDFFYDVGAWNTIISYSLVSP